MNSIFSRFIVSNVSTRNNHIPDEVIPTIIQTSIRSSIDTVNVKRKIPVVVYVTGLSICASSYPFFSSGGGRLGPWFD